MKTKELKNIKTKTKQSIKKHPKSILSHRLENLSKELFKNHYNLITDLIGSTPGVYALYDNSELYYVGRSTDLRKRVKAHLRDKHYASWSHFSLYLVRNEEHIGEIESLLIRIANPRGNTVKPKGRSSSSMLKELKKLVKQKQLDEFNSIFGLVGKKTKKQNKNGLNRNLKGLVKKNTDLFKIYKGKEHKAVLTSNGIIRIENKEFTSPTGAAKQVVDRKSVNGWNFWYIKDISGEWVRLGEYKE